MKQPKQRPGASKQDYQTPPEFVAAVQHRFGEIVFDLAASSRNNLAAHWCDEEENALDFNWHVLSTGHPGVFWLNPPYGNIARWVAEAAAWPRSVNGQWVTSGTLLVLVPASVGSNWYREHVHGKARVMFLSPRLTFVGCTAPFPKDLMLLEYKDPPATVDRVPECWRWKP